MSLRAFDRRDCTHHGPSSLYRYSVCVCCEKEFGVSRALPPTEMPTSSAIFTPKNLKALRGMDRGQK